MIDAVRDTTNKGMSSPSFGESPALWQPTTFPLGGENHVHAFEQEVKRAGVAMNKSNGR
jgi:hypothetical protein